MIGQTVCSIRPGEVRVVRCPNVAETLTELGIWAEQHLSDMRMVARAWEKLPSVRRLLRDVLDGLAETALALWPQWYAAGGGDGGLGEVDWADPQAIDELVSRLLGARREVLLPWVRAAVARCREGKPARPARFPNATHAAQLALTIEPRRLAFALCVSDAAPRPGRLLGLARAAEWIARETGAAVAVLVPAGLKDRGELDGVNFDAVDLRPRPAPKAEKTARRPGLLLWPFYGGPHPASPGEQLLAQRLEADADLAGLFRYNETVQTVQGSRFVADLVWPEGRLVVEVDGYQFHSDREAFVHDRQRDYELLASGYLVLRLPHDEVVDEVNTAIRKIRDVVAFRRREIAHSTEK